MPPAKGYGAKHHSFVTTQKDKRWNLTGKVKGLSPLRAFVSHRTIKDKKTKNAISGVEGDRPCRHQGPRVEVGDCEHHKG